MYALRRERRNGVDVSGSLFSLRRRRCLSVLVGACRCLSVLVGAWVSVGRCLGRPTSNELNGATHQCLSGRYADTHSSRPAKSLLWWRTRHEASERRVWACKEHERASVDYPPCKRAGNVHLVEENQENDGKEGKDIHLSHDPAHAIFTAGGARPSVESVSPERHVQSPAVSRAIALIDRLIQT